MFRKFFIAAAAAVLFTTAAVPAQAQTYPNRTIKIVVPFPAGGVVDVLARSVGEGMSKSLGQPVVIENRPGAGGNTGADAVAKSDPDGYTLLMTSPGILSINQFLYKSMPFEPEKAFAPISLVATMPVLVVVHPKHNMTTLKDLIAAAKANPGKLNFGSPGIGTTNHLAQSLLAHVAGIDLAHVPYRGGAPALNDLIAGHIDGMIENPPGVMAHIRSGAVTALAVASSERLSSLPNVQNAVEAGLPDWQASSWFGLVAPAGTPKEIVTRLHDEIVKALREPYVQRLSTDTGITLVSNTPDQFNALIVSERKKWGDIVRQANIQAQ